MALIRWPIFRHSTYPMHSFRDLLVPGVRKLVAERGLPPEAVDFILDDPKTILAVVERDDYQAIKDHPVFFWWPLSEAWFTREGD